MGKFAHQTIPWAELPIFLALAHEKTLSGAGRSLGIDRTTVARRIDFLEKTLGRALFDRHDGKFQLTQIGRKALAATERADQELAFFGQTLGSERHRLGKVRLSMPPFLVVMLAEPLAQFQSKHPDILPELTATDQLASLMRHETDVALRLSLDPPKAMTRYDLGPVPMRLYASAAMSSDRSRYLSFPGEDRIYPEISEILPDARIVLSVDGYLPMRELIATGAGIGMLPAHFGNQDPRLEAISGNLFKNDMHLWLICLPEQRRLARIQTMMSYLRKEIPAIFGTPHTQKP